jgi:predicted membrane protein
VKTKELSSLTCKLERRQVGKIHARSSAASALRGLVEMITPQAMSDPPPKPQRKPSWSKTLVRALLVCAGSVAILLPAWLPNRPSVPIERGTVELLQAFLLAAAATVMLGASSHAGPYRPVCRILALGLIAAFVGEIEDFVSGILKWKFPEAWVIGVILLLAVIQTIRHRRVMIHFIATLGNHAGAGLIGSALLIIYVFNRMIGSFNFWKAALGPAFSPSVPRICRSYLELLACYLLFIGALGLSITLARRKEHP